jgi:hypothetical protein
LKLKFKTLINDIFPISIPTHALKILGLGMLGISDALLILLKILLCGSYCFNGGNISFCFGLFVLIERSFDE